MYGHRMFYSNSAAECYNKLISLEHVKSLVLQCE